MRDLASWFADYAADHRHPTNRLIQAQTSFNADHHQIQGIWNGPLKRIFTNSNGPA